MILCTDMVGVIFMVGMIFMVGIRLTDLAGITFMAKHTLNVGSQGYTKHESKYH